MHPNKGRVGYLQIRLSDGKRTRSTTVHKIVAEAFIPNPDKRPEVNHKNGIKTDCSVSNLEWVTKSENVKHAVDTGLLDNERAVLKAAELSRKPIVCKQTGIAYKSIRVCSRHMNLNDSNIAKVCHGIHQQESGYTFEFIEKESLSFLDYDHIKLVDYITEPFAKKTFPQKTDADICNMIKAQKLATELSKKKVMCKNDGKKYDSLTAAAHQYGVRVDKISAICKGKRRATRGLCFEYI